MNERMGFVERVVTNCLYVVLFANMFINWQRFLSIGALLHHVGGDVMLYLRDINLHEAFAGMLGAEIDEMRMTHHPTLIGIEHDLKFLFHQEFTKLLNTLLIVFSIVHCEMASLLVKAA